MKLFILKEFTYKDKKRFLFITIIGILLRILWVVKIPCKPKSDFQVYQEIATSIYINGTHSYMGTPIAFQGMGYPSILGVIYKIFNTNNIMVGKLFNVFLSSLTMGIILFILSRLFKNKRIVYITYIIIVFLPNYISYNNVLGSEIFITFLLSVIIALQISNFNNILKYLFIGVFIGLASLTKPFFIVYPVIIVMIEWLKNKNFKKILVQFFLIVFVEFIVIFPWTYRNYKVFNSFVPISYNGGYVLFINNNSDNKNGAWMPLKDIKICEKVRLELLQEGFNHGVPLEVEFKQILFNPRIEKILRKEGVRWIISHPYEFINLGFIRIKNTFFAGAEDIYLWTMNNFKSIIGSNLFRRITNQIIFSLSSIGFLYMVLNLRIILKSLFVNKEKVNYVVSIPIINILFFTLICFVFEGQSRYNFPILFIFSICIGVIFDKLKK